MGQYFPFLAKLPKNSKNRVFSFIGRPLSLSSTLIRGRSLGLLQIFFMYVGPQVHFFKLADSSTLPIRTKKLNITSQSYKKENI